MKKISKVQIIRVSILTIFLIIVSIVAYLHQKIGGGPKGIPSIHSICPFGGLETIYKYIAGGEFLKRTNISNLILLTSTIILVFISGRFFCGFLCAVGWMQELIGKLGKIIFKKRFNIPSTVDKPLRYLKYILLVVILFFTWKLGTLFISPYDPFAAYAHIPAGLDELLKEFLVGTIILFAMLILSLFFDRLFCKYLCPMGAFLAILNKIGLYKISRDKTTCINCNKCSNICPVNIDVAKVDKVTNVECINCMECVEICPTKIGSLKTNILNKNINPLLLVIIGILIYTGTIAITNMFGIWKTVESDLISIVKKDGKLDPYSIRGFMTLKDISQVFNINIDKLYKELNLSKNQVPESTKMKELKNFYPELTEEVVRGVVAKIIGSSNKINEKTNNELDTSIIKGYMTVKELCDKFQIKKEDLYLKLGLELSFPAEKTLKDIKELKIKDNPNFEIEEIRNIVKELKK